MPIEDIAAAGEILDVVADREEIVALLGIRSPMMPKRYPARLENQGIKGI
ncbi:hypothetical protein [Rhizobium cremeum]